MPRHWRWHRQISLIKGGERGSHLVACGSPTFWMVKVSTTPPPFPPVLTGHASSLPPC
jgi:hypothetical protein